MPSSNISSNPRLYMTYFLIYGVYTSTDKPVLMSFNYPKMCLIQRAKTKKLKTEESEMRAKIVHSLIYHGEGSKQKTVKVWTYIQTVGR